MLAAPGDPRPRPWQREDIMRKFGSTGLLALSSAALLASGGIRAETTLNYSLWIPWTHPVAVHVYVPWIDEIGRAHV